MISMAFPQVASQLKEQKQEFAESFRHLKMTQTVKWTVLPTNTGWWYKERDILSGKEERVWGVEEITEQDGDNMTWSEKQCQHDSDPVG